MKSYNEMADCVFKRRDRYNAARAATRKKVQKITAGAACCCLVAVLGVGVMRGNQPPITPTPDYSEAPEQNGISDLQAGPSSYHSPFKEMAVPETSRWHTADEIAERSGDSQMGVSVPAFLSWNGGFYGGAECTAADRFAPAGEEVWFNPEYRFAAYQVKDRPDCVAIRINGGMQIYQKIFDVSFELDGTVYGIQYNVKPSPAKEVLSGDGFTVYKADEDGEYLVNILPLLQQYRPNLFGGNENYADAWQVALPLGKAVTDVPVADVPGSTGALAPYEEVWGGSYTDAQGNQVVLLTENTPENQQEVFRRNPTLNTETTVFQTAEYSLSYLTELLADISKAMADDTLPFVPTAGLYEDRNRVVVTVTTNDPDSIAQVLAFDTLGGAIEIVSGSGQAINEQLIKKLPD